jgi:hypothetical protein
MDSCLKQHKQLTHILLKTMRTGFDLSGQSQDYGGEMINTMLGLIQPVFEQGIVLGAQYSKACGRDVMLDEDIEYAMKYCIMHKVGQQSGSIFGPEGDARIGENGLEFPEDEDEDEDIEVVPVDQLPTFTRYTGEDSMMNRINTAVDEWKIGNQKVPFRKY